MIWIQYDLQKKSFCNDKDFLDNYEVYFSEEIASLKSHLLPTIMAILFALFVKIRSSDIQ